MPSKTTIKIAYGSQGAPAVQLAIKEMKQAYPGLTFNAPTPSTTSYADITKQVVADAAVGEPDDLIMAGLGQVNFWVQTYHPAPLNASALPTGYRTQFLPAGTVNGKVYLAPFQISAPTLLVNQTLLRRAGINPATPITSYAALQTDALAATKKTGQPSVVISTDLLPDWFSQAFVQ